MDKALKQRLVGASVLVALAVVVLPMLLSGQSGGQPESRRIELPEKPPELSIQTRRFPIGDQDASQPSVLERPDASPAPALAPPDTPDTASRNSGEAAGGATTNPPPENGSEDSPETPVIAGLEAAEPPAGHAPQTTTGPQASATAEPPSALSASPPAGAGRYLVQVASFSGLNNANQLAARLRSSGLPVLMDRVDATAGSLHRVRVGPFDERTQADQAIATLAREFPGVEGPRVVDLRPDESAPVSQPSDPLIRWVVQVGSFGESANADNLVFRLRDAGFRASSRSVSGAGRTHYKVWVGPVVERQDAVQLADSIKTDLGLDGLVMSAD